ncbi:Fpg/Nei family DNA glycosylase [Ilumatobacter sp.]|uniref:Fpg/Nei family DNA glycosylase n=1 Tax=Ilumatobacter sp. TaxID=1967498 RepID=UPI003AF4EB50
MPEGHTIHRIARDHGRLLVGRPIRVSSPQGRFAADAERVDGATLDRIEAYGKHLFYWWSTGEIGHVHLGLFGKYRVTMGEPPEPKGALRMRLQTADDGDPVTIDLRGPTACTVAPPDERAAIVERLGPDPLRRDADPERAITRLTRSRRAAGDLLLDQSVIAGLGNIYRAEILFLHGIHPQRPGTKCTGDEATSMWDMSVDMLRAGLKANRIVTVDRDEIGWPRGRRIPRDEATYVYQRDVCVRCGDGIRTVDVANRTCYYCPTDQPG